MCVACPYLWRYIAMRVIKTAVLLWKKNRVLSRGGMGIVDQTRNVAEAQQAKVFGSGGRSGIHERFLALLNKQDEHTLG